jgi:hypothetical protein
LTGESVGDQLSILSNASDTGRNGDFSIKQRRDVDRAALRIARSRGNEEEVRTIHIEISGFAGG